MDSTVFRRKYIEKELFAFNSEPELPLTSWYQPTRDYASEAVTATPQLMNATEERLMARPPPRPSGRGLRGRIEGERRSQPGPSVEHRADGNPPALQLEAGRRTGP